MFTVDFVRFPPEVKVLDVENPGGNPLPLGNDRHSGWIFQRDFMVYCHITKGYHSYPTYYHRFMDPMNPTLDGAHLGR